MLMGAKASTSTPSCVPGRKAGPEQREPIKRVWGHLDDDGPRMMVFFARRLAREQGLVPADTPLMITDRVF